MSEKSPHILMIDATGAGGICHYIHSLAGALHTLPVRLDVLTTREYELDFLTPAFPLSRTLPNHACVQGNVGKGLVWLRSLSVVKRACDALKPDLVHFHAVKLPWIEKYLLRHIHRRGARIVLTLHDIYPHDDTRPSPALKRYYQELDGVVIHAPDNRERFNHECEPPETLQQALIPIGDYEFLSRIQPKNQARENLEIPAGKKVLLFFGYIRKYKGLDILLNALRLVKERVPEVLLVVAGKAVESMAGYLSLIESGGLSAHVRLYTSYIPLERIGIYFSSADAVVLPYRKVDQSAVVYLAAANERPVVVTDVGGLSTLVQDGRTGIIVPPENPERLAEALIHLLTSDKAGQMGVALRRDIRERFGWDTIAAQHLEFYNTVLD